MELVQESVRVCVRKYLDRISVEVFGQGLDDYGLLRYDLSMLVVDCRSNAEAYVDILKAKYAVTGYYNDFVERH